MLVLSLTFLIMRLFPVSQLLLVFTSVLTLTRAQTISPLTTSAPTTSTSTTSAPTTSPLTTSAPTTPAQTTSASTTSTSTSAPTTSPSTTSAPSTSPLTTSAPITSPLTTFASTTSTSTTSAPTTSPLTTSAQITSPLTTSASTTSAPTAPPLTTSATTTSPLTTSAPTPAQTTSASTTSAPTSPLTTSATTSASTSQLTTSASTTSPSTTSASTSPSTTSATTSASTSPSTTSATTTLAAITTTAKTATTTAKPLTDPCYNYTVLDDPRRSTNNQFSSQLMCDTAVSWSGWYRLFIQGQSAQMPDTCVDVYRCGTFTSLWLNGGHPTVQDGVVTRNVCGNWSNNCCYFQSNPIKVKACPGNYYVYEFVSPGFCHSAYCAEVKNITINKPTVTPNTTLADPCNNYTVLDDPRRATNYLYSSQIMCDAWVSWNGWYRLFIQGQSVQMPDTCVDENSCGTAAPLWLNGAHPKVEDGVVTRNVCGNWRNNCCYFRSNPIKVKACPGNYYVYEFVSPGVCHSAYCAEVRNIIISKPTVTPNTTLADPCYNYTVLDDPRRSTNNQLSSQLMCDTAVSWRGWYRLFIQGQSFQMPDTCVDVYRCGTHAPLWLNGGHPTVEDGVVTRGVCGHWLNDCCLFRSNPIKVKACPGNYYVYEFVTPITCYLAYCTEVRNITINNATVTPNTTLAGIFYPFGSAARDTRNPAVDDGSSSVISLLSPFLFFGRTYRQIYVNNNGHLTFNQPSSQFVPYSFPANRSQDIIAGLWTDLDNHARGVVSYHQYTNGSVLTRATLDINNHFPNLTFNASWVFVATWDKVAYYPVLSTETSFQVVLISGSNSSFILMNYGDIAVTGYPVEAGYDTVNSSNFFLIPESNNGSFVSNLQSSNNVNVPGQWAFRVDGGPKSNKDNIIGLQGKLSSFLDLTDSGNIQIVLQQIKQELVKFGLPSSIELELRKVQKIKP